jgi:hypothetical protein
VFATTFSAKIALSMSGWNRSALRSLSVLCFSLCPRKDLIVEQNNISFNSIDCSISVNEVYRALPMYSLGNVTGTNKSKLYMLYQLSSARAKLAINELHACFTTMIKCSFRSVSVSELCLSVELGSIRDSLLDDIDQLKDEHLRKVCTGKVVDLFSTLSGSVDGCWLLILLAIRGLRDVLQSDKFFARCQHRLAQVMRKLVELSEQPQSIGNEEKLFPSWAMRELAIACNVELNVSISADDQDQMGLATTSLSENYRAIFITPLLTWDRVLNEVRSLFDKNRPQVVAIWTAKVAVTPFEEVLYFMGKFNRIRIKV